MSKSDYSKENKDMDKNYELASFYQDDSATASGNVHFNACELCKNIALDPNLNDMSRLLKVRLRLVNVCPGKEVTVGCIVTDKCGKVLAYKSDTFIAANDKVQEIENENIILEDKIISKCGCSGSCIDVIRCFVFILPNGDICSPLDVKVKVIANYTSPCC